MPRVDDRDPVAVGVDQDEKEGDEAFADRAVAEVFIEPLDDPHGIGSGQREQPGPRPRAAPSSARGHPLARHVSHGQHPLPGLGIVAGIGGRDREIVEVVTADVPRRLVKIPEQIPRQLGRPIGQERLWTLLGVPATPARSASVRSTRRESCVLDRHAHLAGDGEEELEILLGERPAIVARVELEGCPPACGRGRTGARTSSPGSCQ